MRRRVGVIQHPFGFCVFSLCLMIVTVPMQVALPFSALLVFILSRAKEQYATGLVASTVLAVFVAIELLLRVIPLDARPQYYRPHELLVQSGKGNVLPKYLANRRIENFEMPYGDLVALSFIQTIMEPRTVNFYTDALGFRNRQNYAGEEFVLFGDSFVVGSGTTQEDTLAEVLTRSYHLPAYSAGFPGGVDHYIERVKYLKKLHGDGFKAIVVVFEGNDFPCAEAERQAHAARRGSRRYVYIPGEVRDLQSYRLFYGLTRRAYYAFKPPGQANEHPVVFLQHVGNETLGFMRHHLAVLKRQKPCAWNHYRSLFESVSDQVALIVFVPTKYRVYEPLLREEGGGVPPNIQSEFLESLAGELSLPYLDVTPYLISASRRYLKKGEYTFWKDDTHWNGNGVRVAAEAISDFLRLRGLIPDV